ncbi:MAG: hypothetical protein LBB24_00740 [Rickettsiales bacterium]|jgi:hypothetical protein|nr:hypothetical protein [Rickettsiales bacterium]
MVGNRTFLFLLLVLMAPGGSGTFAGPKKIRAAPSKVTKKRRNQFDSVVVTKYDVGEAKKIFARVEIIDKKHPMDSRNAYEDMVKKANIARRSGVTLTAVERSNLWNRFSKKFAIVGGMSEFCQKNGISDKFLVSFLENWFLWQRFFSESLRRSAFSEMSESIIADYMEYNGIGVTKTKYNLTEVVANYSNLGEKQKIAQELDRIRERLNSGRDEPDHREPLSAKVTKLDPIFENDLTEAVLRNIKNLGINEVCKPFCIGGNSGRCFVFRVDGKETFRDVDEQKKLEITNVLFGELLNNRIKGALRDYSDIAMVVHRY